MRKKHTRKLNRYAVKVLPIFLFNSFIQFFTHNVFIMVGYFILGGIMYSRALEIEIGQIYNQVLWIMVAMVVTLDCLIALLKMVVFGKLTYLKNLVRRLVCYIIFIKGYYYLQDANGIEDVLNLIIFCGLLLVLLYSFGKFIWPKLFNRYVLSKVLSEDYLASKDFDELSERTSFSKDLGIQDDTCRMRKIDQSIVRDSMKNSVRLESFTSSVSLVRRRKRRCECEFSIVEKRYALQFILFLVDGNARFYYRLPILTFTKLLDLETDTYGLASK